MARSVGLGPSSMSGGPSQASPGSAGMPLAARAGMTPEGFALLVLVAIELFLTGILRAQFGRSHGG